MGVEINDWEWILRITQAMSLDDARDLLAQCLCVHPGLARASYLMAVGLAEAVDMEGALVRFAAALEAEPGLHEARNAPLLKDMEALMRHVDQIQMHEGLVPGDARAADADLSAHVLGQAYDGTVDG
jgi:hypothetical protein